MKHKLFRIAAVPGSMVTLLKGQLRFLNQYYNVAGVATNDYKLPLLAKQEGVRTFPVKIERNIRPWADLVALFQLYRLFRKEKPFMVHSITPKAGLLSMMAAYLAGVPRRIHTFTGLIFPTSSGFRKWMLLKFDQLICLFATHVYPEGKGVRNDLINYGVTKKPLRIIGNGNVNGVDLQHFNPDGYDKEQEISFRKDHGLGSDDFIFMSIGRLVNDKGIRELVSAFSKLESSQQNIKLILVGHVDSEVDQLPKETWDEINSNSHISFVGIIEDVRPYLAFADVLVFPSYREGFPNVVLESGAMGLPAIVSDINGCNEIITHGHNGLIIPPRDENALYDAMSVLLENKVLLEELALNSRPVIVEKFDRNFVWECLIKEYRLIEEDQI